MIDRKTAEAARRRAIEIEQTTDCYPMGDEHSACVKVWNEFCAQETRRLARKDAWAEGEINRGWALHLY